MLTFMNDSDLKSTSRTDICLWLDFYGQLLTRHTRDVLELHYGEDMSLSEIGENLGISRQAVHDRIRQGLQSLSEFESKLELVSKFRKQKDCIDQMVRSLDDGKLAAARELLIRLDGLL